MLQYLIDMKYLLGFFSLNFSVSWTNIQMVKYHHALLDHPMKDDFWGEVLLAARMPSIPVIFLALVFFLFYLVYCQVSEMTKGE